MKHISFIIITICSVLLMASCSCPSTMPTPAPSPAPVPSPAPTPVPPPLPKPSSEDTLELARKFSPVIQLNGEPDAEENFQPDPVQLMVDLSFLRDLGNPTFTEKPAIPDLLRWFRSDYYLDIADLDPKAHSIAEYKVAYEAIKENYQPTVYARVKEGQNYTIVQYWLFYYLNDWRNVHEGDWELVQLHFPKQTAKELLENDELPVFVAYSQHQAGQRMSWSDMEEQGLISGTHPIVYVAQGSHANYFTPGQFWSGLDFDDTGLSSWRTINPEQIDIVLLTENGAENKGLEWLEFKGYWGEYLDFSISVMGLKFGQRGPFGPQWSEAGSKNKKWEHLEAWAIGLPEYPKPFWTSFLTLPGDWSKLAIFSLFSPANLHVYDSSGRHVGLDKQGKLEKVIPGAIYINPEGTDYKTILIPNADVTDEYTVVVIGTDSGTMDIKAQVPDAQNNVKRHLEYLKVPVSLKTMARATIKPDIQVKVPRPGMVRAETVRDIITKLEVDSDGDGAFELESAPGKYIRKEKTSVLPPAPVPSPVPESEPKLEPVLTPTPTISVTYKIEFVADWSEKTHPDDYPSGAHFSPFVAYSHNDSVDSQIFRAGQTATPGIEQMAERGSTTALNQEIDKLISSKLAFKRTRGKLFNSPGIDSSELEFAKDYNRITFLSMIAQSPDWFVSQTVSLLKDEDWIDEIELDLITYDAGSDSGELFTSQDIDTQPKEQIIVFSDNLQRLGKLVLTRIR